MPNKGEQFTTVGVVEKVTSKVVNTVTYYGVVLVGDKNLYRFGKNRPSVKEGMEVEFSGVVTEFGFNADVSTIVVVSQTAKVVPQKTPYVKKTDAASKDEYWNNKADQDLVRFEFEKARQSLISYQAATNTAVEMLNTAIAGGFLNLGAKTTKAENKFEAYVAAVRKLAAENFEAFQSLGKTQGHSGRTSEPEVNQDDVEFGDDD